MNTDNMALSGETIDYGPCAFMDAYDPATVFSSIDVHGRYAYGNQPAIAQWNLARLAEALLPLIDAERARAIELAHGRHRALRDAIPAALAGRHAGQARASSTRSPRTSRSSSRCWPGCVARAPTSPPRSAGSARRTGRPAPTPDGPAVAPAVADPARPPAAAAGEVVALMQRHNPAVIPRNHKVEEALVAAADAGDLGPLDRLTTALRTPYDDSPDDAAFSSPPAPGGLPYRTFCGT